MINKNIYLSGYSEAEMEYQDFQLSFSTADVADFLFYGDVSAQQDVMVWPGIRPGLYYLVDGELRAIVKAAPPGSIPLTEESGLFRV